MTLGTHAVKVRFKGERVYRFVTSDGGVTRLRIHASLNTPDRAAELVKVITSGKYPQVEAAKVVTLR